MGNIHGFAEHRANDDFIRRDTPERSVMAADMMKDKAVISDHFARHRQAPLMEGGVMQACVEFMEIALGLCIAPSGA